MKRVLGMIIVLVLILSLFNIGYGEESTSYILTEEQINELTEKVKTENIMVLAGDSKVIAEIEYKLYDGEKKKDYVVRPFFITDNSEDKDIIEDTIISYYEAQKAVTEILTLNGVPLKDTEWSEYSGIIKMDKKVNGAPESGKFKDSVKEEIREVRTDENGNIVEIIEPENSVKGNKEQTTTDLSIKIKLNGELIESDVKPYITNGRTMMPFRAIFEALEAEVGYDFDNPNLKLVYAKRKGIRVDMQIGNKSAYKDEKEIVMDVAPEIKDGRTFIPVRYASELLGAEVEWIDSTRTVLITTN